MMKYKSCAHSRNRRASALIGGLPAVFVKPDCPNRQPHGKHYIVQRIACESCKHYEEVSK